SYDQIFKIFSFELAINQTQNFLAPQASVNHWLLSATIRPIKKAGQTRYAPSKLAMTISSNAATVILSSSPKKNVVGAPPPNRTMSRESLNANPALGRVYAIDPSKTETADAIPDTHQASIVAA